LFQSASAQSLGPPASLHPPLKGWGRAMGASSSLPDDTKYCGDGECDAKGLEWGHSSMQGWRATMEDAHFAIPALQGEGWHGTAAFGVMDGHGGKEVAHFCAEHLPEELGRGSSKDLPTSLHEAFLRMDERLSEPGGLEELQAMSEESPDGRRTVDPDYMGCTALVACVRSQVMVVANAGDCRAVLCRGGRAINLSEDHKPNLPRELKRISAAGGSVQRRSSGTVVSHRINGHLNLSRSLGDLVYKRNVDLSPSEQMVSATPDIVVIERHPDDEFLLLACDGIWDVLGSQEAVDYVRGRLPSAKSSHCPLSVVMEELLDRCLSPDLASTHGLGGDNMTAIIVLLNRSAFSVSKPSPTTSPNELMERETFPAPELICSSGCWAWVSALGFSQMLPVLTKSVW